MWVERTRRSAGVLACGRASPAARGSGAGLGAGLGRALRVFSGDRTLQNWAAERRGAGAGIGSRAVLAQHGASPRGPVGPHRCSAPPSSVMRQSV